ncbi:MAG: dithiol-disulfide isomerase [Gammaproteobacteria bacterium]|nr:MAG: dithiol-disulfide isomerase [Gammaproteobacteria bacterium]
MTKSPVHVSYFSDLLCVWAYVAQERLNKLKDTFKADIEITPYHVTLFGDTQTRIAEGWKNKGGYVGFGEHVQDVCKQFPHLEVSPNIWKTCQPKTSGTSHLFLKAIQCYEADNNKNQVDVKDSYFLVKEVEWAMRLAFFRDGRDISDRDVLYDIANQFSIKKENILNYLTDGQAMALFCSEMAMKETYKLSGSPTYILNENRQKLFGNVSYNIMKANVAELLNTSKDDSCSWC